ncbi:DUF2971 domain-containing protein (plasmid) [Bradyrhizobium sp. 187]|nr:DUF2971 domain-containing protein [Bradyrhizobium sp. 187]
MRFEREHESVHAFVGSLTANGHLLSQWRGYNRGQGFSIGFDADWLLQNAAAQGFDITPIIYDTEQQHAAADAAVALLVALLLEGTDEPEGPHAELKRWWPHALKTALVLKNEHFREECESRLVWADVSWPAGLKRRVAPAGLVPYRYASLTKSSSTIRPRIPTTAGSRKSSSVRLSRPSRPGRWRHSSPPIRCALQSNDRRYRMSRSEGRCA